MLGWQADWDSNPILTPGFIWSHRYQRKYLYQKVERTLCQPPTKNESEVQFFYVDVSTLSPINTTYQLRVSRIDDFVLRSAQGGVPGDPGMGPFSGPS